jgi:hypothetical protein
MFLIGVLGAAFAAGRSTLDPRVGLDPVALEHGMPIGVLETPAGALAAADNYMATGISASLDPGQLRQFADTAIDPAARARFISTSQSLAQGGGPPVGARVIADVIAHRLESYRGGTAVVDAWALGSYWDGGVEPTQYSALVKLSLRWDGDGWQLASVTESLPGPVPGLVAGPIAGRSAAVFDRQLSGMLAPYYGDG